MKPLSTACNYNTIQDVIPYYAGVNTPSLSSQVRRSIGDLDEEWRRQRASINSAYIRLRNQGYTKIAPLGDSGFSNPFKLSGIYMSYALTKFEFNIVQPLLRAPKEFYLSLVALPHVLTSFSGSIHLFPKAYRLDKGLVATANTRTIGYAKKMALPLGALLVAAILVSLLLKPGYSAPNSSSGSSSNGTSASSAANYGSPNLSGGSKSTASNSTTSNRADDAQTSSGTQIPVSSGSSASQSGTGSTSGASGTSSGSGSGSSPSTGSGSSNGIPGVTTPEPVTVPGTSLGLGGKQVVGSQPITVTLN